MLENRQDKFEEEKSANKNVQFLDKEINLHKENEKSRIEEIFKISHNTHLHIRKAFNITNQEFEYWQKKLMKIFAEEGLVTEQFFFSSNEKYINAKLKIFYDCILSEELSEVMKDEDSKEIEHLRLNPLKARKQNSYSFCQPNFEKSIHIQSSSFFTKFLILADLIFRISNVYKYIYKTAYKGIVVTLFNVFTIKLSQIDMKDMLFKIDKSHLELSVAIITGLW